MLFTPARFASELTELAEGRAQAEVVGRPIAFRRLAGGGEPGCDIGQALAEIGLQVAPIAGGLVRNLLLEVLDDEGRHQEPLLGRPDIVQLLANIDRQSQRMDKGQAIQTGEWA